MALIATQALLCNTHGTFLPGPRPRSFDSDPSSLSRHHLYYCKHPGKTWPAISFSIPTNPTSQHSTAPVCRESRRKSTAVSPASEEGDGDSLRRVFQVALWTAEAVYISWLFLLPYAPVCIATSFSFLSFSSFLTNKKIDGQFLFFFFGVYQGDPVWAISSETINALIGLSLNFLFILPLTNAGTLDSSLDCYSI